MALAEDALVLPGSKLTIMPSPKGVLMVRLSSESMIFAPMVSYLTPLTTIDPKPLTMPATGNEMALVIGTALETSDELFAPPPQALSKPAQAIAAKSAKIDKKLKMVDLQLKKLAIDRKNGAQEDTQVQGEGYILTDRNSILEKLRNLK